MARGEPGAIRGKREDTGDASGERFPARAGQFPSPQVPEADGGFPVGNGQGSAAAGGTKSVASNGSGGKPDGEAIWKAHCSACHETGVAGAPKIGDTKEWGPILAKTSKAKLYDHAINGFKGQRGYMPPKGGASGLSDAEVKAAVDYMVGKSGG